MKILGIIPAKEKSVGLPNKHLMLIKGNCLIEYTFQFAEKIDEFDEIFLTTDSEQIIELSKKYKRIKAPFLRPKNLSLSNTTTIEVIQHLIQNIDRNFTHIVLLQPTSPFRQKEEISKAIKLLEQGNKSIIGVSKPFNHPADFVFKKGKKNRWILDDYKGKIRQKFPEVFFNNGALYAFEIEYFLNEKKIYDENSKLLLMNEYSFIDIDEKIDFIIAKNIIENEQFF